MYYRHREEFGAVLLDVAMPGMDGPHTLAALRQRFPAVRCCFMTGNPAPYTEEGLLRAGAVRVFRKPFNLNEVIETLQLLTCRSPRGRSDRWVELPTQGA